MSHQTAKIHEINKWILLSEGTQSENVTYSMKQLYNIQEKSKL